MTRYIYIHIPFCLKKCIYCDFYSIPARTEIIEAYVDALCKEFELRTSSISSLDGIYIGGGTPSILGENDIKKIMDKLSCCDISAGAEITAEANPGTLNKSGIRAMLGSGINRISIGIQSLDNADLSILGRIHNSTEAVEAFNAARKGGFKNISVDLIYGIPGQTIQGWGKTLELIVGLHPEHISTYELTPEKNTALFESLAKGDILMPDEEQITAMYYEAIDKLHSAGYNHYEISNFAQPDYECRHNLNYWDRGEYVGLGAAAHSFIDGKRTSNLSDAGRYISEIDNGKLPIDELTLLTEEDVIKERLFLGLRKTAGVDMTSFSAVEQEKIREALKDASYQGLCEISGNNLRLTRKGLILCNAVIVRLMEYIELPRPS